MHRSAASQRPRRPVSRPGWGCCAAGPRDGDWDDGDWDRVTHPPFSPLVITEDRRCWGVASQSEMEEKANTAPRPLFIEWTGQI